MTEPDEIQKTSEPDMLAQEPANTAPGRRGRPRTQTPQRDPARKGEFVGRDGEVLTRRRVAGVDEYHIPPELIPDGWEYQWNAVTIYNNHDLVVGQAMSMYENGWRPVPASRHPGKFVPIGTTGAIIRGGMRLEERPKGMSDQARFEEKKAALRQMQDRDESLMGSKANLRSVQNQGIPVMGTGDRRGTAVRMAIDPAVDIPMPSHPLAEPGE